MIELYHFWSSVCSVRCRMALEEKGVPWVSRYIDLFKFDQLKPEYLAINPDGVVPTLVHDGAPVRESTIINEYIDAAFPGPALIPKAPLKQARMREFIRGCEDDFDAIVKLTMVKYLCRSCATGGAKKNSSNKRRAGRCATIRTFIPAACAEKSRRPNSPKPARPSSGCSIRLEKILDPGPWIVGDEFSLADIAIAPYMFRLSALGNDQFWSKDRRSRVHGWYGRVSARPAFQTAVSWPDESGGGYEEVGLKAKAGT